MLTPEEGKFLLDLSFRMVDSYSSDRALVRPSPPPSPRLQEKIGIFITIKRKEPSSGGRVKEVVLTSVGYPMPNASLFDSTIDAAIAAAVRIYRCISGISTLIFEVSVISPPNLLVVDNPLEYPKKIRLGRDGLLVERGFYKGVLLPQAAVESGWDELDFLSECCQRAGLLADAWTDKDTKIYRFEAQTFRAEYEVAEKARKEKEEDASSS